MGQYNKSRLEDLDVHAARDVKILVLDAAAGRGPYGVEGEYALATIDLPASLAGSIFAGAQDGYYRQGSRSFLEGAVSDLPRSYFETVVRFDRVDFDRDLKGDDVRKWTLGVNFRPTSESVFKLDYFKSWSHDRFNVLARGAGILFSVATYF